MTNYTVAELKSMKKGDLIDTRRLNGYYCRVHGLKGVLFESTKDYMSKVCATTSRSVTVQVSSPSGRGRGKTRRTMFVFNALEERFTGYKNTNYKHPSLGY